MIQVALPESARADRTRQDEVRSDHTHETSPDVAYQRVGIVNVAYFGRPAPTTPWVLIDTGLPGTSGAIKAAARARFGKSSRPACIIMTHAHADHAGNVEALAEEWNVPVYAHSLELPYLNGAAAYPPPDPSVGGGMMPALSLLFPRGPFNVLRWLGPLPADFSVPEMPGWRWLHTPGHTPGHVSLWRQADRTLIVGDAFVTTNQESVYAALIQKAQMHGPPTYYTQNWEDAQSSVELLASLAPEVVITGHGRAMRGEEMRAALRMLSEHFRTVAVPKHGRYVEHPASANAGSAYVRR